MKRKITFLIAALMLLTMINLPGNAVGQTKTTKTYKLTISPSDFNTTSYAANNNEKTSYAVNTSDNTDTYQVKWTSNQVMHGTGNNSNYMQWQSGKGYIYNSTNLGTITGVTVTSSTGTFTTKYGSSENTGCTSFTVGNGFFKTSVGNATGYTSKIEVTFTVTTYTVTYDSNEATSGTAPTDSNSPYLSGSNVTVLGNTGSLEKVGHNFAGWCLNTAGTGTVYGPGDGQTHTLSLSGNTVFYAKWEADGDYITISPTTKNVDAEGGAQEFTIDTDQTISTTTNAAVQFYSNIAGTVQYEADKPSWITSTAYSTATNKLTVTVAANHTASANGPAYFRVKNSDGSVTSDVVTISQAAFSVATPEFDINTGNYYVDQLVDITCDTQDATIYYTTDGTTPAANNGTEYDGNGVEITATTTLKAIAIKYNVSSEVATATYTFPAITISEARALSDDQTCTTIGVISYVDTKNIYIQDASAAIVVYNKDASYSSTYSKGDKLAVSGTKTTYCGLVELKNPTINQKLSSDNTVTPVVKTIAQINDNATNGNNSWQAMLVTIERATYDYTNDKVIQGNNELAVYGTMGSATNGDMVTFTGNIGNYDQVQMVNMTDVHVIVDPVILAASSIAAPNYIVGATSSAITYEVLTVNGTNLTNDIIVTLEKEDQSDFEISDDLDTWGYSITLDKGEGTIEDAEIAVRLKSGKSVSDYSDKIILSSDGATTVNVNVSGSVTNATLTYNGNGASSGDVPAQVTGCTYNQLIIVAGNTGTLKKDGHTWSGWCLNEAGTGTVYGPNYTTTYNMLDNTTLYAKWTINSYDYTLNVTGDDDDAEAELEVDNNPVAPNAKIAYGKEVTVNVVVTDGYIYSISVNNGAVAVTNDKFTMPAGDVTVTVTTEANPYIKAKLLSADILNMTTDTQNDYGYGTIKTKEITSNDTLYVWQTNGYQHTNNNVVDLGMIQLRVRTNVTKGVGYIKLPDFAGKIETIKFDVSGNGNSDTSPTSSKTSTKLYFQEAPTSDGTIIAEGGGSATNTITISLADKCYTTGYIVANGGLRVWNIVVTYRPYQNMSGTELTTVATDQTISIPASTNATAMNLTIPASSGIIIKSGATLTVSGTLTNSGNANNIIIEENAQLICGNSVAATMQKSITAASAKEGEVYGWYAISSPMHTGTYDYITPANVTNLILADNKYDLFYYDEPDHTWMNYKVEAFNLNKGQGYIYRNSTGDDLTFVGNTNVGNATYTLKYNTSGDQATLRGFNLIGNPYPHSIYKGTGTAIESSDLTSGFYTLSNSGSWTPGTDNTTEIKPEQGILVEAISTANDKTLTITDKTDKSAPAAKSNNDNIKFMVANSQYEDVAYALFDKGFGLSKINHRNADIPMLYINQEDADYAIATMSDDTKSFNLNFKAMTTGKYTLSYKADGNFSYLHVIDRLTGEDVDMLLEGEYSFIASPIDSENRFIVRLEYSAGSEISESSVFAYQSGNDIIVNGEGELQIFDMMGRRVLTQYVSGVETINLQSHGVYIFKLNEKTQKIVVK